jgi:hypothetical protein
MSGFETAKTHAHDHNVMRMAQRRATLCLLTGEYYHREEQTHEIEERMRLVGTNESEKIYRLLIAGFRIWRSPIWTTGQQRGNLKELEAVASANLFGTTPELRKCKIAHICRTTENLSEFRRNDGAAVFVCEINSLNVVMCIACARNFIVIFVEER